MADRNEEHLSQDDRSGRNEEPETLSRDLEEKREAQGPGTRESFPGRKAGERHGSPEQEDEEANPPRTTTGPVTAPKFGSAGSGGAELEPGPKRP